MQCEICARNTARELCPSQTNIKVMRYARAQRMYWKNMCIPTGNIFPLFIVQV
jgi:hypothetical protein